VLRIDLAQEALREAALEPDRDLVAEVPVGVAEVLGEVVDDVAMQRGVVAQVAFEVDRRAEEQSAVPAEVEAPRPAEPLPEERLRIAAEVLGRRRDEHDELLLLAEVGADPHPARAVPEP